MTGKLHSAGASGKAVLDISVEREACPMHLAPTSSTVNTLMMGDALAIWRSCRRAVLTKKISPVRIRLALGARLLNNVHHLMRRGDDVTIPRVMLATSVMDAMLELSRTGLGLVAVCDRQHVVKASLPTAARVAGWWAAARFTTPMAKP